MNRIQNLLFIAYICNCTTYYYYYYYYYYILIVGAVHIFVMNILTKYRRILRACVCICVCMGVCVCVYVYVCVCVFLDYLRASEGPSCMGLVI